MGRCLVKKPIVLAGAAAAILVGAAGWIMSRDSETETSTAPAVQDIAAGKVLYGEYCAVCHGVNLEGQPDWRSPGPDGRLPAPPHDKDGHTWHHSDRILFDYTKRGGKVALADQGIELDSGMPGFGEILEDAEIWNILAYIKSTWPERERLAQVERTAVDNELGGN